MKIIRSKEELEGSCYIEVLPGEYVGECWSEKSIFFTGEVFGFIEKSIKKEFPEYDHYAFNEIHRENWFKILSRLDRLINYIDEDVTIDQLKIHVYFVFADNEQEFQKDFDNNIVKIREIAEEFQAWIKEQLETNEYISVLGI